MAFLDAETRAVIKKQLEMLTQAVTLHVFTQEFECGYCRETRQLAQELAEVAPDLIKVAVHDFVLDKPVVAQYQINKIPAIAIVGQEDYGVRFYGIPAGYEFTSLLQAVKIVSTGQSGLSQATRDKLGALTKPVHLKVFVTPTCPYCPAAVQLAHQLAVASPLITAEAVEAGEFPHLANKEQVMGVPKTVVEGHGSFEGAVPEPIYVNKLLELITGGGV
jgi:glutaredoxin-like protein